MYTEKNMAEAEENPSLGPEYFAARDTARCYMKHFKFEHLEPLVNKIAEEARDAIWDDFCDFLLSDTESNLHSKMRSMVEDTVNALLSEQDWALNKYALADTSRGREVRAAVAKLIPEQVQNKRIEDLERELAFFRETRRG